jgi:hypothetical protein
MMKKIPDLIDKCIKDLKGERPIFHSEADFQHSLAIKFEKNKSDYGIEKVRLEKRMFISDKRDFYIDIVLITNSGKEILVELKYKTKETDKIIDKGEEFKLKNHGARDLGGFDFFKDISRIEEFKEKYPQRFLLGYVIFLSNDLRYLESARKDSCYVNFCLTNGREIIRPVNLDWNVSVKKDWQKRRGAIKINGHYCLNWDDYSLLMSISKKPYKFKYIVVEIV